MITNMKRTIIALLAAFAALSFSSCVRDEEPIFEESASVRLQNALKNAHSVLVSAENGWRMYYYPDPNQSYGGYLYTMKFTEEEVEVWSELFDDSSKSLYKMATDDGPVLSFDTNNYNFHFFATPSGSSRNLYGVSERYQGYKGDFEFLIVSATKDEVVLKGKRSGNRIVMYPLAAGETPEQVANDAYECSESLFVSMFDGTIGSDNASVYVSLSDRWISIELVDEKYSDADDAYAEAPFAFSENGLLFYKPVKVGPYTISGFTWDLDSQSLVALPGAETSASLKGKLPDGWHAYEDFLGTYSLTWAKGARTLTDIKVVEKEYKKSYTIKGLSSVFDMTATYDLSSGTIGLCAQSVGSESAYSVFAAAWAAYSSGSLTWTTSVGLKGQMNEEGNSIAWGDNGVWGSGNEVDSFIIWYATSAGSVGQGAAPWLFANGSTQLYGWVSFDRQQ